jgi:hypothetical protein
LGVKTKSNQLIVADQDTKTLKYVRIAHRVPEEQRWDPGNLEWVEIVPWNRGHGGKEADGNTVDFDVKNGPGRKLTEEEKTEIAMNDVPRIVHRVHLRKGDFEKHGCTYRLPGCSDLTRTYNLIRQCVGTEWGETWRRTCGSSKTRLQERARKEQHEGGEDPARRRKVAKIEDQAMAEEDPNKLAKLFEQYKTEYLKDRGNEWEQESNRKKQEDAGRMQEVASCSQDPALYQENVHRCG